MAFFSNFPPTVTGVELHGNGQRRGFKWVSNECGVQQGADTTPAYDPNENVIYQTCPGYVRVIDANSGLEIKQYQGCEDCVGQPIVLRDHIIVRGRWTLYYYSKAMVERPMAYIDHQDPSLGGSPMVDLIYFKKYMYVALANGLVRSVIINTNCDHGRRRHEEL